MMVCFLKYDSGVFRSVGEVFDYMIPLVSGAGRPNEQLPPDPSQAVPYPFFTWRDQANSEAFCTLLPKYDEISRDLVGDMRTRELVRAPSDRSNVQIDCLSRFIERQTGASFPVLWAMCRSCSRSGTRSQSFAQHWYPGSSHSVMNFVRSLRGTSKDNRDAPARSPPIRRL